MCGDSDYERVISDLPVEQLRSAMGVATDKELISVLKRDYSTEDAFDRFLKFAYDNHLKYNIYCKQPVNTVLIWQRILLFGPTCANFIQVGPSRT